jgi:PAS domain S-box-containing protein
VSDTASSDAEEQLLLSETIRSGQLSELLESMPAAVVVVSVAGRIALVNCELERMFGHERAQLVGRHVECLLPQRYRTRHAGLRAGYWADPLPRAMGVGRELFGCRGDNTEFPVEIGLRTIGLPEGRAVLAAVVDISARTLAQTGFQSVVEAAPYGLLMADGNGKITLANAQIERMFGYSREEMLGRGLEMLLPERYRGVHANHRLVFARAPAMRTMGAGRDLMAQHRDGTEFPVEIGLNPIGRDGLVLAAVIDITWRKRLELELRQANTNLEEFTYVASHDLKSPIRGISDLVQWIAEDLGVAATPAIRHNLDRVSVRTRRLERIIDDLLSYARAGRVSTELVLIEARELVTDILDVQPVPIGFKVTITSSASSFKAAKTPLETVLRNLIGNAIKHHDCVDGNVDVTVEDDDAYCLFTVTDNGPGIPTEAQERVFRMFQTLTASEREGSGMGLALTKRLVEAHGGRVTLESRDGQRGAKFRMWWPRFERRSLNG